MNTAVYWAARNAGCSAREAEVVATYVVSESAYDTALKLQTTTQVVRNYLARARQRTNTPHNAALVATFVDQGTMHNHSTQTT